MRANPCPGGPDHGSSRRCRGFTVDHIVPLACCGIDAPQNMQWQTKAAAKAKDRWELDCELAVKRAAPRLGARGARAAAP